MVAETGYRELATPCHWEVEVLVAEQVMVNVLMTVTGRDHLVRAIAPQWLCCVGYWPELGGPPVTAAASHLGCHELAAQ